MADRDAGGGGDSIDRHACCTQVATGQSRFKNRRHGHGRAESWLQRGAAQYRILSNHACGEPHLLRYAVTVFTPIPLFEITRCGAAASGFWSVSARRIGAGGQAHRGLHQ